MEKSPIAKMLLVAGFMVAASTASATCKSVWVDHDYNASTPAVRKQVCDSTLDIPAINSPSVRPIQQPQVRPITSPSIPPIGTSQCSNQSVYENGQWVTKRLCN